MRHTAPCRDELGAAPEGGIRILARSAEESLRQIVQSAASVAGLLLTTEVMIAEAPKDESDHMHPSPGGGMGDMGGMGM